MKKCLFTKLFILFISCLTISCSQDSTDEDSLATEKSEYKIDQVIDQKNEEDQKVAYTLLSNGERYTLWVKKYESLLNDGTLLKSGKISLNSKQKLLIEELKNKLTESVFDVKDNNEKEYFRNIYVPDFLKRAQKVFTYDEIGLIFYKISKPTTDISLKKLAVSARANSEKDCDCNVDGFFTCQWGQNLCKETNNCVDKSSGCGFNWAYPCDGDCAFL